MKCPWCGGPPPEPVPGMGVAVCRDCYWPSILKDADGAVRKANRNELTKLHADPRVRALVGIRIEAWVAPPADGA